MFPLWLGDCDGFVRRGRVIAVEPTSIAVRVPGLTLGSAVSVQCKDGGVAWAEVRRVGEDVAQCTKLSDKAGVVVGAPAESVLARVSAFVGRAVLGQAVDAWGRGAFDAGAAEMATPAPQVSASRRPIQRRLRTGIAAIDGLCTIGAGQRVALASGAGVGKSTLLRQLAERIDCDAYVFALIGERAREAAETIALLQQQPRWPHTTVVSATAARPAHERLAALRTAQAQARWLCAQGADVLLCVDSLTRVAHAWRELAAAEGEPLPHRGHPASLAGLLATAVENAGAYDCGSITAVYAVLVDGDDQFEPVTDTIRGLLDGYVALSRKLAESGRFPAIDPLRSNSRLMGRLSSAEQQRDANDVRRALATLEESADLLAIGAYQRGEDRWLDAALSVRDDLDCWLFHREPRDDDGVALHRIASVLRSAWTSDRDGVMS